MVTARNSSSRVLEKLVFAQRIHVSRKSSDLQARLWCFQPRSDSLYKNSAPPSWFERSTAALVVHSKVLNQRCAGRAPKCHGPVEQVRRTMTIPRSPSAVTTAPNRCPLDEFAGCGRTLTRRSGAHLESNAISCFHCASELEAKFSASPRLDESDILTTSAMHAPRKLDAGIGR
jgi:hypothetical protein